MPEESTPYDAMYEFGEKNSLKNHLTSFLTWHLSEMLVLVWTTHYPDAPSRMRSGADQCGWLGLGLGKAGATRVRAGCDWSRQVTWPKHWPLIGRGRVTWPELCPLIGHHPLSSWRPPLLLSRGGWGWLRLGWQLWGSPWPGHQVFSVLSVHQHHQPRHHSGQQVCDDHQGGIRVWGVIFRMCYNQDSVRNRAIKYHEG